MHLLSTRQYPQWSIAQIVGALPYPFVSSVMVEVIRIYIISPTKKTWYGPKYVNSSPTKSWFFPGGIISPREGLYPHICG